MTDVRFYTRRCLLLRAFTASLSITSLITTVHAVLPIIALVPDAWHSPIHYLELTQHLSRAGYSVTTQRLPSCGSELPEVQSTAADAAFIRENVLLPQIDNGKAVVLVMHSYGGCPGAVAAKGLSMSERRTAGQKGGIIGMIFICGFIIRAATILRDLLPSRQFDPWIIQYGNDQLGLLHPTQIFYNDVPPATAELAISNLLNQSLFTFETPTGNPAWSDQFYDGRRSYLKTELDKAILPSEQQWMIDRSTVEWQVESMESGHCPFLSRAEQLSAWIVGEIMRWGDDEADVETF